MQKIVTLGTAENEKQTPRFFHRGRRVGLVLALTLLSLAYLTSVAAAHALLIKSEPESETILEQPPHQITAWFSQELDTGFSTMQVFNAEGNQVDNGDGGVDLYDPDHASMIVTLPASLPGGAFIVHWTVISAEDGDMTEGEFSFGVGENDLKLDQIAAAENLPPASSDDWPIGQIIAAAGVLLLVIIGVILFPRFKPSN